MRSYFIRTVTIFLILATALVLPGLDVFRIPQHWFHTAAYDFCRQISGFTHFQSDGSGVYFSLLVAFAVAFLPGALLTSYTVKVYTFAYRWSVCFLALVLLKYGLMKLNFTQFYIPDPNILDTRLGSLSQDTVYWSLVGSSGRYQLFMGITEVLTAGLLLFRRTRFVGLLLAVAVFVNIAAVNFSFDISVKLLSLVCLVLAILLLLFHLDSIGLMFHTQFRPLTLPERSPAMLWTAVLTMLLSESIVPLVSFETADKLPHQGSYRCNGSTEKFYIHRLGYVILQEKHGLTSYPLHSNRDSLTTFIHQHHIDSIKWSQHLLRCSLLNRTRHFSNCGVNTRFTQSSFHWTSDEFH